MDIANNVLSERDLFKLVRVFDICISTYLIIMITEKFVFTVRNLIYGIDRCFPNKKNEYYK